MKKIPRPTCRTCVYWDQNLNDPYEGLCKYKPPENLRESSNFCGQHQDFSTYEAAVRIAGPKCTTCKNLVLAKKSEKANMEFLGKCKLTRTRMYEMDGGCYLHEKI